MRVYVVGSLSDLEMESGMNWWVRFRMWVWRYEIVYWLIIVAVFIIVLSLAYCPHRLDIPTISPEDMYK